MRSRFRALLVLTLAGPSGVLACEAETGPDAPARIDKCGTNTDCNQPGSSGGPVTPGGDAGTQADGAPISYPDPLEGTSKNAKVLAGGFGFAEGPVWVNGHLFASDTTANVIRRIETDGGGGVFRSNTNGANGNAVDPSGSIVTCESSGKRVIRTDAVSGSAVTVITPAYNQKPYNAPNDVVVRSDGNVYFTDPNYGSQTDTQDARAAYRVDTGGVVTRLGGTFQQPNGIALSPNGGKLYVVDNGAGNVQSASVATDGSVGAFAKFVDAKGGDGMAVDDAGNLYVAGTAGVLVFDATGKSLGTVALLNAAVPTNCAFGGADRQTLFITANVSGDGGAAVSGVYSIHLNVPGLP